MQYCQTYSYPLTGGLLCYTSQQRFLDKANTANEQALYNSWWTEQINMFGQQVDYYVYGYALSAQDVVYGEQPEAAFQPPVPIIIVADISNDSMLLSRFGITSTADITCLVPIDVFHNTFGATAEPKSGDVIFLTEFGEGRPGGRTGQAYQITERDDESVGATNQLMGHYVWTIKGTRFEFSFENGAPQEGVNDQVYDNLNNGIVSSSTQPTSPPKLYGPNVGNLANQNFNYGNEGVSTDVYGGY